METNSFKETFKQWAVESKTHGITNIFTAKSNILRIIWILCFLVSLGYCVDQLISFIITYSQFYVISNYKNLYEVPTEFPTVDICNLNPYDGNQLRRFASNLNLINNSQIIKNIYFIQEIENLTENFKSYIEYSFQNDTYLLYLAGFFFYQMLISCQYNNQPCLSTDFQYYHNYHYGSCYSFNIGYDFWNNPAQIRDSIKAGAQYGLQLELFVGDPYLQQLYTYSSGIKVLIRNKSSIPFPEEKGIEISPGTQTNIVVSRLFINHLPLPYNDCIDEINNENYERNRVFKIIKSRLNKTIYDQTLCLKICTQLNVIDSCKCFDYSLPNISFNEMKGCYSQQELSCLKTNYEILFNDFVELCDVNCPMKCSEIIYNSAISFSIYPTKWYAQKLIEDNGSYLSNVTGENQLTYDKWNFEYLQRTTLKLNVYFDNLFYTIVDETPALTIDALISNLGGYLGLFLGMSILSFIEAFELGFYITYHLINDKLKEKDRVQIIKN